VMFLISTFRPAAVLLVVLAMFSSSSFAQSESGGAAIVGTVTDQQGAVLPGVTVTARQTDTAVKRTVVTDGSGRFSFPAMPVGRYEVEVTLSGFSTVRFENLVLTVGATERLSPSLTLAGVSEVVTVSAVAGLDRMGSATGTSIDSRAVADLPIRGRNFAEFAQLTPAIVQEGDRAGLVIAGQRSINSNIAIDGADFNDPLQGNQRGGNETAFFFPQSAVREFQVVRSGAGAEVGRTGGGFVNVVTQSGTNQLRGDAFYFNRNKALTSPDAFDQSLDNRQNQFGGSLGGRLVRNRVFFFTALEQNLLRVPFVVRFEPQASGVQVPAELRALEGETYGTNNPTAFFGRVDAVLSNAHTFSIQPMYTRLTGENFNFDSPRQTTAATANFTRRATSAAVKASLTSVLGSRLLSDVRAQVATDDRLEDPNSTLAQVTINGFGTFGGDSGRPRQFDARRVQFTQNLTWTPNHHQVRLGVDANFNAFRQRRSGNIQGRYDYTSLANFVAGRISRYRQTVARFSEEDLTFEGAGQEFAVFVQDAFQLASNLTLNAGLRWEGQWNPQPDRPNPAFPETGLIPNDLAMWQPRLGLAWDTSGTGATVLRVSSGIYASRTPANLFQRVFTDNGLTSLAVDSRVDPSILSQLSFPNALPLLPDGTITAPQRIFGFDPDFRNPRTIQASATLDQQLGGASQMSVGYVFANAWQLQRRLDRNLFPPTINQFGMPIYPAGRPDPTIAQLSINESTANSQYHALTASLVHRLSGRVQAQVNYTLASNRDDDSNERNFSQEPALNVFDPGADWGWSKQDVRHSFNASTVVDLPRGFLVSAILVSRSGFPFTPVIGSDTQRDGNDDNDRAIIDGRVVARNSFRQPSFFNLDLRLMKSFGNVGGQRVALFVEAFNVTRASNLNFGNDAISVYGTPAAPVRTAGQPLFAPSTARFGGPRQLQLGLRVNF